MSGYKLYTGHWPRVVSKTAKYSIRKDHGEWRVSVHIFHDNQIIPVSTDGMHLDIVERVNDVKLCHSDREGGPFYINEFNHLVVPVITSNCYFAGRVGAVDFEFTISLGKKFTSRPVGCDGAMLKSGDRWIGPSVGIPYRLANGGKDIYFKSVVFTGEYPPKIIPDTIRKYYLTKICPNSSAAEENIQMVKNIRGINGGRFYVNEHLAVFTPVTDEDEENFVYCGQLNLDGWFPEPSV